MDLPYFKDEFFKDLRNTSNYACQRSPPVPVTSYDPLDKELLRESVKELTAIMSSKWIDKGELSSKEIQIRAPSLPIHCKIQGN